MQNGLEKNFETGAGPGTVALLEANAEAVGPFEAKAEAVAPLVAKEAADLAAGGDADLEAATGFGKLQGKGAGLGAKLDLDFTNGVNFGDGEFFMAVAYKCFEGIDLGTSCSYSLI